jgi:ribose-phosphate pyrophosphokinase
MVLFTTAAYAPLAQRLCAFDGVEAGALERKQFPDGERYLRVTEECSGRDCVVLGGTVSDADTLELYDLACALVHQGAHTLTLVIPYYGYQTMERAVKPGEVVVAKTRARLLSSIPTAGSGNRVVLLDLHAEGIPHYFSGSIRPLHVYAKSVIIPMLRELGGDGFVLGATDAGRAKWVESLANDLGVQAGFVFKRRLSGAETEVTALAADVAGRKVVIYDDMIRTGGSLIGAARSYLDAGASEVAAVCTHGVFPANGLDRLASSGLFTHVACTDSHPAAEAARDNPFLRVTSIAPVLRDALVAQRGPL